VALAVPAFAQTCDVPSGYANATETQEGDIHIAFATDKAQYEPGEPINFILIVTNTGTEQWYLNSGMDPQNAFILTFDACTDANDPACGWLYLYPQVVYQFGTGTRLDPGACRVWTHTTHFDPFYPAPSEGSYRAFGGMAIMWFGDEENSVLWQVPANGLSVTVLVESSIAVDDVTWGRVKALYR
jgi:hypothetical protein